MKKVTGTISFIGGIISSILLIYGIKSVLEYDTGYLDDLLGGFGFFIVCICVIHYTVATKFWRSEISVVESLERDNEIIRKQIEKKELLVKLQNLEEK